VSNRIEDLRDHLFETIKALRKEENPMELDRAKTIAQVASVVIDSAKAENEFMKITGEAGSGFIPAKPKGITDNSQPGVTTHRIKG
jgi:hypothetical protein